MTRTGTSFPGRERRHACSGPAAVALATAEDLARRYPVLSVVVIRESLEGKLLGAAVETIEEALRSSPANPQEALRRRARREETGFYGSGVPERPASEERGRFAALLRRRERRARRERGHGFTRGEVDALASAFYGPRTRAGMKISERLWESYHEGL